MTTKPKTEGPKTLGSYKYLSIDPIPNPRADTVCPICNDTASKRNIRNHCACQLHREYK